MRNNIRAEYAWHCGDVAKTETTLSRGITMATISRMSTVNTQRALGVSLLSTVRRYYRSENVLGLNIRLILRLWGIVDPVDCGKLVYVVGGPTDSDEVGIIVDGYRDDMFSLYTVEGRLLRVAGYNCAVEPVSPAEFISAMGDAEFRAAN